MVRKQIMSTVLYSALEAPTRWNFLIVIPLLFVGGAMLFATLHGEVVMRRPEGEPVPTGLSALPTLLLQLFISGLLLTCSSVILWKDWRETTVCRNALLDGTATEVSGTLTTYYVPDRKRAPSLGFDIGDQSLTTDVSMRGCDCGSIAAVGLAVSRAAGREVTARVWHGHVLHLELQ